MSQRTRILIAVVILIVLVTAIIGIEAVRRSAGNAAGTTEGSPTAAAGSIPIYLDGQQMGAFNPSDLEQLEKVSFVDAEEGKTQGGWLLRDVILLYVKQKDLEPGTLVTVSSSSRGKSAQLTWSEVNEVTNWVMFDLSGRGTLKLVSVLERLDVRDEWIQDVDRIEIANP